MNCVSLRVRYVGTEATLHGRTGWAHRPANATHEAWDLRADDDVDLSPDLLEDLRGYVAGLSDKDPDRFLFATSAGTPLDPKNIVNRICEVALTRAELRQIRWSDLQHTYASLQLAAGANIKYLSQQMVHASLQITLDRYSHLMQNSHPAQAAKLSSLVFDAPAAATILRPGQAGHPGIRANTN